MTITNVPLHHVFMTRFLCLLMIYGIAIAAPKKLKTFVGTFESIQSGDYTHLNLKGSDKKMMSFICVDLPKSEVRGIYCFDFQSSPEKFSGKRIKVTYYEETNFIKEANESIKWNYADRIDFEK